jgi:hypothetical protein
MKKPTYEDLRHELDTNILQSSNLATKIEQQGFINRSFVHIHKVYKEKQVNHADYVKLINRLASYKGGAFNDYIDLLAGAAQMNTLDLVIQGEIPQLTPEASRERSHTITDLTGVQPVQLDQDN